jgi:hypothetical protein
MPSQEHRQNSGLVIIALALAGVLYLGQIFHARWGGVLAKMAAAAVTEQVKDQDVYTVTSDGGKKKYWKNDVETQAFNIDGRFNASADSVFVSGGDVYAAGYEVNPYGKPVATVWKNGSVLYRLGDGMAELVFVR